MAGIRAGMQSGDSSRHIALGKNMAPSAVFLFLLVLLEYGAYFLLRYTFRTVHGG